MDSTARHRRTILVATAAVLTLAGAGCATDTSTPAGQTTPSSATDRVLESTTFAPAAPAMSDDELAETALETVLAEEGIDTPSGFAVEYAQIVCEGLEDGLSLYQMVQIGHNEIPRYSQTQHAFMVGASIGSFCPEFSFTSGGM